MIESTAMERRTSRVAALLCFSLLCLPLTQDRVLSQSKAPASRLPQLLEQSGYNYSKVSDNVWVIPFNGKILKDFNVIITPQEGLAVIFVIVAQQKELKVTPELMRALLRMNADFDRVKVGIDKDGDLFVRVDASERVLDVEELKTNIEQVAAAADEVRKLAG